MPMLERVYEMTLRAARPALGVAARFNDRLARGLAGRRASQPRLEAWASRAGPGLRVWIHAPSVGEGLMARAIISALREERPDVRVVFTWFSPSAERIADDVGADVACYLPWDVTRDARRALAIVQPRVLAFVRTEIWPVLTREAKHAGCGITLVNAVLSEGSGRLTAAGRALLGAAYRRLDAVGAVSEADARRFTRLGVPPQQIHLTGDARFDQACTRADAIDRDAPLLQRLAAEGVPVIVAGSTWPADVARLIPAFAVVRRTCDCRLVVAPHEPTEAHLAQLESALADAGLTHARLGAVETGARADVVVVDRMGVLAMLYAAADIAYVGGGFGRAGLHAVVEPAALGVPVVYGPHHGNTAEAARLAAAGGGFVVRDMAALRTRLTALLKDAAARADAGRAARAFVDAGRGGAVRNAALITKLLEAHVDGTPQASWPRAVVTRGERLVAVHLPAPLREHAGGAAQVEVAGETVGGALEDLSRRFPRLRRHLFDDGGALRRYVNVYLNDEDVRRLPAGDATRIGAADIITIVPSVAGGTSY